MIYITGCAKSGTTLLGRLFYAFDGLNVIDDEVEFDRYLAMVPALSPYTVIKRGRISPFTFDIPDMVLVSMLQNARARGIKIVNIIRDGRDVVTSDGGAVGGTRWISCIRQSMEYAKYITAQVKYEELVSNPDKVQKYLADKLGFTSRYTFSSYPDFVPDKAFNHEQWKGRELYKPRRITTASVGKDLQAYKTTCRHCLTEFKDCLAAMGYIK